MVLAVSCFASGCGPIGYVNQVTRKATASIEAARAAQAETYSPYWYTLAVEYLHKAREEASYADYQAANRFGRKAKEAADKARDEAISRAANPSDTSWLPPEPLRQKDDSESTTQAPADPNSELAPVIAKPRKPARAGSSKSGKPAASPKKKRDGK